MSHSVLLPSILRRLEKVFGLFQVTLKILLFFPTRCHGSNEHVLKSHTLNGVMEQKNKTTVNGKSESLKFEPGAILVGTGEIQPKITRQERMRIEFLEICVLERFQWSIELVLGMISKEEGRVISHYQVISSICPICKRNSQ